MLAKRESSKNLANVDRAYDIAASKFPTYKIVQVYAT